MADKPFQSITIPELNNTYVNIPPSTASNFDISTTYAVNDIVFYNRKLYKFVANHAAGAWNNSHVEEITIGNEIKQIENDLNDKYEKPSTGIPASDLASGVIPDVSGKADKVQSATSGNFASLDSNGNLVDSGHKHSDYLTQHQDISGKADKVKNATSGNFASLDANGNLTDSGHKHSDYLTEAPVTDVQVNETSVKNNGVANIPIATTTDYGVMLVAVNNDVKNGTSQTKVLTPYRQAISVFYGLAKAAGDTTQSSSSNSVGTYTDDAKAAIKSMLGVQDSTQTIIVSGTTPTITALTNTRYICGEVATLTITPPGAGICEVVFTSGSTPTVLTATGVTFPSWFDSSNLEADTTYEISIADGKGVVCTWAS